MSAFSVFVVYKLSIGAIQKNNYVACFSLRQRRFVFEHLLLDAGPLGPVSSKAMHLPTGYLCGWLAMWGFSCRADATMATASFAKYSGTHRRIVQENCKRGWNPCSSRFAEPTKWRRTSTGVRFLGLRA